MNREIKFRAWSKHDFANFDNEPYMSKQGDPDLETLQSFIHLYGDEKLLTQYIGIKDKNKVEIFEGDIIKWGHLKNSKEYSHRYAIVEINPDIQFKIIFYVNSETGEKKPTDNHIFHWGRFAYGGNELEVIGNIFQNPELLEGVEK